MRKNWHIGMIAALAAMFISAQPVWAASPVLAAGGDGEAAAGTAVLVGPGGETGLMEEVDPLAVLEPGAAEMVNPGAVETVEILDMPVPIETAEASAAAGPGENAAPDAGAGPGASGTSSPVIVQGAGKTLEEVSQPGAGQETQPDVGQEASSAAGEGQPAQGEVLQPADEATVGRQVDPSRPMVALTYDDGPQPSVGNRIMDCVAQYDGKVTFFMVGDRVPSHAAEVQRMVAEGHEVANHTLNHRYLQKLGAAEIQAQVNGGNDVIQQVSGVRPTLMRLPGGNQNATVRANTNMPMIQWSIDTLDWKTRNADATVASVLNQVKDGDIILMHELYSQTADATERIVPELVNRGYQLVTVSEMAAAKGVALQPGQVYSAFH